jgi:Sec-independent protein translocase protein TatA
MSILGIGPLELFFIVIIALIVLGPRDMVKAGRSIGRLMRRTIFSPTWINVQNKVRNLPYELMREAGLEEEDLKIDPKDIDLGLDKVALQSTTAQFTKDVEKAIEIPSEWTDLSASTSNSTISPESDASVEPLSSENPEGSPVDLSTEDKPEAGTNASRPAVSEGETRQA